MVQGLGGPENCLGGPEKGLGGPLKGFGGPEKSLGGPEKSPGGPERRPLQCDRQRTEQTEIPAVRGGQSHLGHSGSGGPGSVE